ncbi:MAG: copper-binding protein [Alphaproteobacteria bacterium]|jgi:Cu(I)/Ag(I) efflux system periplasmic protein CusF|nr:copper-binding protein [Alphaproteobacteria bacterium]
MLDETLPSVSRRLALAMALFVGFKSLAGRAQTNSKTEGEVRRVNLAENKVTLRHGPIDSLDMPGMTMIFTARDPGKLSTLNVGDKVRFTAEIKDGVFYVTEIEKYQ